MRMTSWQAAFIALALVIVQPTVAGELDGVYERVSLENARTGASPEGPDRAGLLIIAGDHYAMLTMKTGRRALDRDAAAALDDHEELAYLREWLDVNAHSGRIKVSGDRLTWYREISEDPREVGTEVELGWKREGEQLVLSFTLPNGDRYDWRWRQR